MLDKKVNESRPAFRRQITLLTTPLQDENFAFVKFRLIPNRGEPISVSYTHLDVYKRQVPLSGISAAANRQTDGGRVRAEINVEREVPPMTENNQFELITVSYTHLDVYKRQVFKISPCT